MPIVDPALAPSAQPRERLDQLAAVPDFQSLGVEAHFHLLADQPARHGIRIAFDVDRAPWADPHRQTTERLKASRRQPPEHRLLLLQPLAPRRVPLVEQLAQKAFVGRSALKIARSPQHERLIDGVLETPVRLFDVAVLAPFPRLRLLRDQTIVRYQARIPTRELLLLRKVVHRQAHPVGAMASRNAAQFEQRLLQPLRQALKALGKTDGRRFPIRIGQHEMIKQMIERLTTYCHSQAIARGEVRRRQPTRMMDLREEHLLRLAMLRLPLLHPPLQRPQLPRRKLSLPLPKQPFEQRLRLKPRILFQLPAHILPYPFKRVRMRPPRSFPVLRHLARQPPQSPILAHRLHIQTRPQRRVRQ